MNHYPPVYHEWYVSPPERGHSGNGLLRGGSSQVTSPGTSTGLLVKVAEDFIPPPPIDFTQFAFKEAPSTGFRFDFTFEKEFLQSVREEAVDEAPAETTIVDPWESRITHLEQMGHSRDAILQTLAIHFNSPDDKVGRFLERLNHMTNMGFDLRKACMALSYHHEDIQAAAETLIALDS